VRTVKVPLADRSYPIRIGTGLLADLGDHCARLSLGGRCVVISDHNVARRYLRPALSSLKEAGFNPIQLSQTAGEQAKTLENVQSCYDYLARHRLERGSFVVALGGGVVGDLAGFVAATYLRGIDFIQVPTTLLAAVDSSVGGKVGVNLEAGKNLVGAFFQPKLVLCDLDVLRTLPAREFRAGLAEVIKYGIIYDPKLFLRLEREVPKLCAHDPSTLSSVIARCCQIKAEVVGKDEREAGVRTILNFGHTIGHGLEAISDYGKYLHGEAISIGQVAAAKISEQHTGLPARDCARIISLFKLAGLPTHAKLTVPQTKQLFAAMQHDKKVSGGEIQFVLAKRIGQVISGQNVEEAVVRQNL
jgi:3-dehydroquinate synthase